MTGMQQELPTVYKPVFLYCLLLGRSAYDMSPPYKAVSFIAEVIDRHRCMY